MSKAKLKQLGRYRIVSELGRGAMGVVYRAEDPLLNRTVAIKCIILMDDPAVRADYEARFFQEAKAAGGLNHPNLVTIHDVGREGDIAYMAMELLEGTDLRALIERGPVPLPLALEIMAQAADGLAHAHEHGVVHRDIKPGNIMIVRGRVAKVMDFGIARVRASDVKTQTGAILGSPRYMSPEQVSGQPADRRSDIFSLGVVLYELATGEPPFTAPTVTQLMHLIATATPRAPSATNPAIPPMLDLIVARALQKQPAQRYQRGADLAADLRACLAEIAGGQLPQPATRAATTPRDRGATAATQVDVPLETTTPPVEGAAGSVSATATIVDAGTHLPLSRKFDSTAALQRLTEQAAAGSASGGGAQSPAPGGGGIWARARRYPGRLFFAVSVAAASATAYYLAYYY
ncbi:MAG TPA: serine/threonine-protein kinase [Burkholderiales bacterium]|nr:serine/threonine-protein kinase [Burkholderiales bacterium]